MRLSRLALAAALMLAAWQVGASGAGDELPGDLIESCLTSLEALSGAGSSSESPLFDLDKHCPRLVERLAGSLDSDPFGSLKTDATSIEGLRDLESFAAGFHPPPGPVQGFHPDFDGLEALLSDVLIEESIDDGLWERFLRWLEQYAKAGDSGDLNRLVDWLEGIDPPPWLGAVILNTSLVLIVLLALMVIGNELRLAGLLRRVARPPATDPAAGTLDTAARPRTWSLEELRNLPSRQLAAGVLDVVTTAFADRGWISASSSLTNGERVKQLTQCERGIGAAFAELVDRIEKVIYGDRPADEEARRRLVAQARELVEIGTTGSPASARGLR